MINTTTSTTTNKKQLPPTNITPSFVISAAPVTPCLVFSAAATTPSLALEKPFISASMAAWLAPTHAHTRSCGDVRTGAVRRRYRCRASCGARHRNARHGTETVPPPCFSHSQVWQATITTVWKTCAGKIPPVEAGCSPSVKHEWI